MIGRIHKDSQRGVVRAFIQFVNPTGFANGPLKCRVLRAGMDPAACFQGHGQGCRGLCTGGMTFSILLHCHLRAELTQFPWEPGRGSGPAAQGASQTTFILWSEVELRE